MSTSTHLGAAPAAAAADANLTVADSGGSPTLGMTGPQGAVAPLPATPTTMASTSGFLPHEIAPPTPDVVDNQAVMLSSESAIHGAEKAVETMKIYEGAVGKIQLVMNIVDAVVEVCMPSLLLSINGTTLAL